MKKHLVTVLRILVPAGILAYLLWTIGSNPENVEAVRQIFSAKTRWWSVAVAFGFALCALSCTFIRWYLLVISVGIPFRLKDAFRLGFLGYMLNFVGLGGVGGDLFKGYMLAKDNPHKRPEAISTIFMDRLIGLYALFVVTSLAALSLDLEGAQPAIRTVTYVVHGATLGGLVGLTLIFLPGFSKGSIREFLEELPKIGGAFKRIFEAAAMYRRRPKYLVWIGLLSLGVHSLFSVAAYFVASGLFEKHPSLFEMMVITPLAMVFAAIPLSPGGMGTLELAITELYVTVPSEEMSKASAITVALGFRALTIGLAFIGAIFYWTNRSSVDQSMAEVSAEEETLEHLAEASDEEFSPSQQPEHR
ncbi:lysylphosphatidylglycerol synthase transmembrane domain-containing protein [Bremerella sp. T1]|uniref:lysylphosphatidylglycerol synthase transmembrane domain-containing protein n=1 Tax=Bremerella sp. TYQ1 TaxID=3119568 RepID=UPI001CCDDBF7|nr:lysylphosphatidylglycerol synthase transmembrane domain-containing protein [Bremerella volcania]UBM36086.1 flippase-like domain-containing protein [Bremerella volcania]